MLAKLDDMPEWLYRVLKAILLIGLVTPVVLWAMQYKGVAANAAAASVRDIKQDLARIASPVKTVEPVPANAGVDTLKGIDVSHYQQNIDWSKVAGAGVVFAYAKATGGSSFVDPAFSRNWQSMREAGLYRGAYHFFLAGDDPKVQAEQFIKTIGKLRRKDLPPMLDVETDDDTDIETLQERALVWLQTVEKSTGRTPVVYTDNGFADKVLTDPRFARYPFWIADYAGSVSGVPNPWEKRGWQFWQYEDSGSVAGITGEVDLDKFQGTLADLRAFVEKSHVK
ncbi:glycoside hydrolase family 25 protein [Massilia endophytica]|uniref:glycoside hydrolase family 25 protein n=1 Tax=Massilia endophytica TaxID=2899220 RepID=UPI001E3D1206|nr:glycoside hydrolase family 25 protein [Massilia endophytica]UGQ45898.1 glycoside hydrolase family 25 protein [Massilia endophytica]